MMKQGVTIEEVKAAKREAEAEILAALERLQERTHLDVRGVYLESVLMSEYVEPPRRVVTGLNIELEIL